MSIIGYPFFLGGGGSDTYEMIGAFSSWKSATGSNNLSFNAAHTDALGDHYDDYFEPNTSTNLTVLADCELAFVLTSRVANDTRRNNRLTLQSAPTSAGTYTDIAVAIDNSEPLVVTDFQSYPAGTVFQAIQNNATNVATVRTLQVWIRNP